MFLALYARTPPSFLIKIGLAASLAWLADLLIFDHRFGATLGVFALAVVLAAGLAHPALRTDRRAQIAGGAAVAFALLQIETPSLLGWVLYWTALVVAVLSPRVRQGEDGWAWLQRLAFAAVAGWIAPLRDAVRFNHGTSRACRSRTNLRRILAGLVLPGVGGALFLLLFASANPVIANALTSLTFPPIDAPRLAFWLFAIFGAWSVLRPARLRRPHRLGARAGEALPPPVSGVSIALSLAVFNAIFALQNGLDIAFLWSGARLPTGMTLAGYAHRGAYALVASALLAGLFVLVCLRPGSAGARHALTRNLVVLWVGQNVFLVASSILRTLDYIDAYCLTPLRIAALAWMGLVATGLMLICWRMLREKTSSWLIDANLLAAGLVLTIMSGVDLDAASAAWNVDHAREVGGRGAELDLCYLENFGDAGLVSLARLEQRDLPAAMKSNVAVLRSIAQDDLAKHQGDWRTWTWRGLRRLQAARALPGYMNQTFQAAPCED